MNGIQRAENSTRGKGSGGIEEFAIQVDLIDASKLSAGVRDGIAARACHRPNHLNSSERTGYPAILLVLTEESSQRVRLQLLLHELDERRGVQIEPHRSAVRIVASTADASTP